MRGNAIPLEDDGRNFVYRVDKCTVYCHRHTPEEFEAAWTSEYNLAANPRPLHVEWGFCAKAEGVTKEQALTLSALCHFHFADENCCHYDESTQTFVFYCYYGKDITQRVQEEINHWLETGELPDSEEIRIAMLRPNGLFAEG